MSPNGNDQNDGSVSRPFATLDRARVAMEASGVVKTTYVQGGTYALKSTLKLGQADSGMSFIAASGQQPVLDGQGSLSTLISLSSVTNATIQGLSFIRAAYGGAAVSLLNSASNTIAANHFANNDEGLLLTGSSNNVVSGNQLDHSAQSAVEAKDNSNNNLFDSNLIDGTGALNTQGGGFFLHGVNNNTISHNLVKNTAGMGIGVENWDSYTINVGNKIIQNQVLNTNVDPNSTDSGAIYILGRSQLDTKSVISGNIIDNTGYTGSAYHTVGVYLDDLASGVLVQNNIIRNAVSHAVQIHGGQNVTVQNNIFDLGTGRTSAVLFQDAPADTNPTIRMTGDQVINNILLSESFGPELYSYINGGSPIIGNNLYYSTTNASLVTNPPTKDSNPSFGNPNFVNAAGGNYNLQAGSAASTIGFQAIDQNASGLHPTGAHWY